jgi:hypothetical protein
MNLIRAVACVFVALLPLEGAATESSCSGAGCYIQAVAEEWPTQSVAPTKDFVLGPFAFKVVPGFTAVKIFDLSPTFALIYPEGEVVVELINEEEWGNVSSSSITSVSDYPRVLFEETPLSPSRSSDAVWKRALHDKGVILDGAKKAKKYTRQGMTVYATDTRWAGWEVYAAVVREEFPEMYLVVKATGFDMGKLPVLLGSFE